MIEATVSITAAFVAGVVTAFLPCTFPMLIGYLALLSGSSSRTVTQTLLLALRFFLGFALVYTAIGIVVGLFGFLTDTTFFIGRLENAFFYTGAFIFILLGLVMLRAIPLPRFAQKVRQLPITSFLSVDTWYMPSLVGATFALGWSPCIGPTLAGILFLAASAESVALGGFLLFVFSLGLVIPLLLFSVFYAVAKKRVMALARFSDIASTIGGVLFILLGIGFLFGALDTFSAVTNLFVSDTYGL